MIKEESPPAHDGSYSAINPWVNGAPIDPQRWIPQMGPFMNAEAYNSGSSWSIFDVPFTGSGQGSQTGSSSSGSSSGGSGRGAATAREPISPVSVTPQPITAIPSVLPSGGTAPAPRPQPVIPGPNCVDCGF